MDCNNDGYISMSISVITGLLINDDYDDDDADDNEYVGSEQICNTRQHWDWQGEEYCSQKDSNYDVSQCIWNEVALNEEDLSYMLDETTPVKSCGDLAYHINHSDSMDKEPAEKRDSFSQLKRRRMLQFDTQPGDSPFCNEDISSVFLQSNEREDSLEEVLPQASEWLPGFSDASASSYEVLDQSSEGWLAECLNDTEMHLSPNDMNFPGASDVQIDISVGNEASVIQKRVTRTPRNVVFKGKKSFIRTPTKLASSVVYPFAFIKPCGFHGDVTLKDINQRIRTPPPSKSKQNDEDPTAYPTSAFSGKPVVGKTKIRTEGGKGSITIMRTKG
ncbi:protein XRI1 isoform X2 [Jatropha curcas]|uniref:protein XRI1 isoform X2 n=1 Tax=Jatropha curcas TaxID=180498 RepID=UPI0009D71459|nr:protein XRI1 isoform X2 [Jatropha curcas]